MTPDPITVVKAPTWLSANATALLTVGGSTLATIFSAIAMYFGNKNHGLTTQIHVDTDGRLSAMTAEIEALKQAALMSTAVATATKTGTDKAAVVAATAADLAAHLLLKASPNVAAVNIPAPAAGGVTYADIVGKVDASGKLDATSVGTVK
jgi:hypothetical protein